MSFPEIVKSETQAERIHKSASLPIAFEASSLPLPSRIAVIGNYLPHECGTATFQRGSWNRAMIRAAFALKGSSS